MMINTNTAARDIIRGIEQDMTMNPNWFPSPEQVEHRIDRYCDDDLTTTSADRARILMLVVREL